jgi:hypothetical protein
MSLRGRARIVETRTAFSQPAPAPPAALRRMAFPRKMEMEPRGRFSKRAHHQVALGRQRGNLATSTSAGFASSRYRRRYLSAARSNFRSAFSAYSSTSARPG